MGERRVERENRAYSGGGSARRCCLVDGDEAKH